MATLSLTGILQWITSAKNSIKGYLNVEELLKTLTLALGSGATVIGVLSSLQTALPQIITDPTLAGELTNVITTGVSKNYIGLGISIAVILLDGYRRLNAGATIVPVPQPAPVVVLAPIPAPSVVVPKPAVVPSVKPIPAPPVPTPVAPPSGPMLHTGVPTVNVPQGGPPGVVTAVLVEETKKD